MAPRLMLSRLMLLGIATLLVFVLANRVSSSVPRVRAEAAISQTTTACGASTTLSLFLPAVLSNRSGLARSNGDAMRPAGSDQAAYADFNCDGYADLAIGVPNEAIGAMTSAGAVNVLYGSADGLSAAGNQMWDQDTDGLAGAAETGDSFGEALTVADFDGDGFSDLAIGVPSEDVDGVANAGAVQLLYGSAAGLIPKHIQIWHQNDEGIEGATETDDRFGAALTAADFDGDGFGDLAIGIPSEGVDGVANAGAVQLLYGSAAGLMPKHIQIWHQNDEGIEGAIETDDRFGAALTVADFDGDGFGDLAIGVISEDVDGVANAGAVQLLYGSAAGLMPKHIQIWHQNDEGIEGATETDDHFGAALTAADFDGDGFGDLAIGVIGEDVDGVANAGVVQLLYGSAAGLMPKHIQIWHQNDEGIEGATETDDLFGAALTAADFDGDDIADLAIGVPGEGIGSIMSAGAVQILYGSAAGVAPKHFLQIWHQDVSLMDDDASELEQFGSALAAGDFDGDGIGDLAIGVPYEELLSSGRWYVGEGIVQVLYGAGWGGVQPKHAQIWHQDIDGILGGAEPSDFFGWSLASSN